MFPIRVLKPKSQLSPEPRKSFLHSQAFSIGSEERGGDYGWGGKNPGSLMFPFAYKTQNPRPKPKTHTTKQTNPKPTYVLVTHDLTPKTEGKY